MNEIYDRMKSDLCLARRSKKTATQYLQQAQAFVQYHMKSPSDLGEAEIRAYLHHLMETQKASVFTQKMATAAIKFLYTRTLGRGEEVSRIPWPRVTSPLPEILTRKELLALFESAPSPVARAGFMLGYGAGLRVSEVCHLRVKDIDSGRGAITVRQGKGGQDRLTLLSSRLLRELRVYWKATHPGHGWLFPGKNGEPIPRRRLQDDFRKSTEQAKITRKVTYHSLRHAFATHMLEAGVDIRIIQAMLGHKNLKSTSRYTQVRVDLIKNLPDPLALLEKVRQKV